MDSLDDTHVRVWACKDASSDSDLSFALFSIEGLWGPMTALMGTPLPDIGGTAGGGDPRIDIYLLNAGQSLTREGSKEALKPIDGRQTLGLMVPDDVQGDVSSGYILLQRFLVSSPKDLNSVMAHEFFHLQEFMYNDAATCQDFWFTEAAAKWAEWYFVPEAAPNQVYPWLTTFQDSPGKSLFTPGTRTPYSDFIWAMYMQQQHGAASIASAWQAMVGVTGCAGLNAAIDAQVAFAPNFGHFAVENFDSMLYSIGPAVLEWPVCSACQHYQDMAPLTGTAPPFPQDQPHMNEYTLTTGPSYPWKTTVSGVNLPQLSAEYDDISVSAGSSVEFDFSKLTNPSDLDVNLIAADNGSNGSYVVVPVTGTDEKVCVAADGASISDFYVVLDNHDAGPPAQITGTYTVTARSTCALSLAGTVSVASTQSGDGVKTTVKDTMHLKLKSAAQGWGSFPPSSGTYSGTYKQTGPADCPGGTYVVIGTGSGAIKANDLTVSAYQQPYSITPVILAPVLVLESAQGVRTSPCDDSPTTVQLGAGFQCPTTDASAVYGPLQGSYSGSQDAVAFDCSSSFKLSNLTYNTTIGGTLNATGVFPCGLWQPDFCSLPGAVVHRGMH
jgi:hypothetical protein